MHKIFNKNEKVMEIPKILEKYKVCGTDIMGYKILKKLLVLSISF